MDFQDFAIEFKRIRKESGYSQQKLADDLCISRATINAFENGRAGDIGLKKVLQLLGYLEKEVVIKDKARFPTLEDLKNE